METKNIVRTLLAISVSSLALTAIPIISDFPAGLQEVYDAQWDISHKGYSVYTLWILLITILASYIAAIIQTWRIKNSGIYIMATGNLCYFIMNFNGIDFSTNAAFLLDTISDSSYAAAGAIVYLKNRKDFQL